MEIICINYIDRKAKLFFTLLFLIVSIASITSCNFFVQKGMTGVSLNVKESKNRGVFIHSYVPPQNPYVINDSLSLNIRSAWLEHMWRYTGSNTNETDVAKEGYQLIIIADKKSLKGFNDKWLIGTSEDSTFYGTYKDAIITEFKELPATDTIKWKVQSGNQLAKSVPKTIIGKFVLVTAK